jgi:hypothetical protein
METMSLVHRQSSGPFASVSSASVVYQTLPLDTIFWLTAVEAGVPYIQSLTRLDARGKCVRRMAVNDQNAVVPVGQVERSILLVRGVKVMLDCDLARLYGTATKAFNQAVKRNSDRFPPDFMFQLTHREKDEVVTNCDHLLRLRFSPA